MADTTRESVQNVIPVLGQWDWLDPGRLAAVSPLTDEPPERPS
jgi:hypothetical protein